MFLGTYTPKLDDKGRLTLPAKFRDALAGGLMVTKSQDHSLAVYPRAQFEQLAQKATQTSRSNPEARAFLRNLAAGTDEQHPDTQGRITLSADHRRYAHLSKRMVKNGDVILSSSTIGAVGTTGRSTGPHLHFEVRQNGAPLNPVQFLRLPG